MAFLYDPKGMLPSLALIQQGESWYLWLAGTVAIKQWIGNVTGAMWRESLGGGVYAQGYFWGLAQKLWALGQQYLPPQSGGLTLTVVGHSLGGAVAQVIANLLVSQYSAQQVKLLTFGQPKCYSENAEAYNPFAYYSRFRMILDPVPKLPLDEGQTFWGALASVTPFVSSIVSWRHYGKGWVLTPNGQIISDPGLAAAQDAPFVFLVGSSVTNHLMGTYVGVMETALGTS